MTDLLAAMDALNDRRFDTLCGAVDHLRNAALSIGLGAPAIALEPAMFSRALWLVTRTLKIYSSGYFTQRGPASFIFRDVLFICRDAADAL
jgi:hypothetical protein